MPQEEPQLDTLPPAIVAALRELDGPAVLPDAQRDADVLSGARSHLADAARLSRKRRSLRLLFAGSVGGALAAAAAIAIVVMVGDPLGREHANAPRMAMQDTAAEADATPPHSPQPTAARPNQPGDLDASGNIDILDAYALAKRIERGTTEPALDLNADGQIDQRDIDHLANRSVLLNPGERS